MKKRCVIPVACMLAAFMAGCAKQNAIGPGPTPVTPSLQRIATANSSEKLPTGVPYYSIANVQEQSANFGNGSTLVVLKKIFDIVIDENTSSKDIRKVLDDVRIRESAKNPDVDWMFFYIYDDPLDVGAQPTRGTGTWAEFVGGRCCVSENAARSNNHSRNVLQVIERSYARSLRTRNGDGYDLASNTITPFEEDVYNDVESLYRQYGNTRNQGVDMAVADRLLPKFRIPRSMIIKLHHKVQRLKASGVAPNQSAAPPMQTSTTQAPALSPNSGPATQDPNTQPQGQPTGR